MEALTGLLPNCRSAMVPGAGHAGPHTHADALLAVMEPFLSSLSDESPATAG